VYCQCCTGVGMNRSGNKTLALRGGNLRMSPSCRMKVGHLILVNIYLRRSLSVLSLIAAVLDQKVLKCSTAKFHFLKEFIMQSASEISAIRCSRFLFFAVKSFFYYKSFIHIFYYLSNLLLLLLLHCLHCTVI